MSGRGLGHTGGTLDKLESIPGFMVELEAEAFVRQVGEVGLAIVGQTPDLVPADQRLYALRDVTATVEEVSLIAASIMSKKIAAGAGAILLDVKVGEGAFMKTPERARLLAETMLDLGRRAGRRVVCELTAMDEPLGRAVGNALEVREALATLRGEGPPDFTELVLGSAGRLLAMSDLDVDEEEGRRRAEAAVATGRPSQCTSAGSPRREAIPTRPACRGRPCALRRSALVGLRRRVARARHRPRRRLISGPVAHGRRIPSTTPRASSAGPSAAIGYGRASRSPRCMLATSRRAERGDGRGRSLLRDRARAAVARSARARGLE